MLTMVERAQFRRPVRPNDRLDVDAEITTLGTVRARVSASASVAGQAAASAVITYVLAGIDTATVAIPPDVVAGIRAWDEEIWRQLTGDSGTDPKGET
jgi:acyl-CoA thioesterase FadM